MKGFNEIAGELRALKDGQWMFYLKSPYKVSFFALAMLPLALAIPVARAESTFGIIFSVDGAVQIVRDGKTLAASNGMALQLHDQVVTLAGGSVTIVLHDHSELHLDQSGKLSIDGTLMNERPAPSK
jgi:hypothetical protein